MPLLIFLICTAGVPCLLYVGFSKIGVREPEEIPGWDDWDD